MRHQFTPIFKEFTASSMWAKSSDTRIVWLYMMLHADPEGYYPGTVPGLAIAANVSLEATRQALEVFISPDPDSNTLEYEGRRLEKVPHGWRILNFEYWRRLAQHEAEKARKRRWVNQKRSKQLPLPFPPELLPEEPSDCVDDASGDVDNASTYVDCSEKLDAPKSKSIFSSSSSSTAREAEPVESRSPELTELPADMAMPAWLETEARIAGVQDPQRWFDKLKVGRIGGDRGVLEHQLDNYLRLQIGSWRTWEETERAKSAQRQAAAASPRGFAAAKVPVEPFEPEPHLEAFARKHGLDLKALLKGVIDDHPQPSQNLSRRAVLAERLTVARKQQMARHPVTGKLTREESAAWGPCPPGGSIPTGAISVAS